MIDCGNFTCGKVRPGQAFNDLLDCRKCWGATHVPALAESLGRSVVPLVQTKPSWASRKPLPTRIYPCVHLGEKAKPECACTDRHCLIGKGIVKHLGACQTCESYERRDIARSLGSPSNIISSARTAPTRAGSPPTESYERRDIARSLGNCNRIGLRHLVYHLLPVSGNGLWQEAVRQLRLRWALFTGRKIVSIATGAAVTTQDRKKVRSLDTAALVRSYLPADVEVIEVPNNPGQWERVSWPLLWERVLQEIAPDDAILYAHAKGVTRPNRITTDLYDGTPQIWAQTLYTLALDYWPEIEAEFTHGASMVGPMRKDGRAFYDQKVPGIQSSEFHYSGNFWWVRASAQKDFFRTPVPDSAWGAEAWPGLVCPIQQAANIGPLVIRSDSYRAEWWNTTMIPEMAKWVASNRPTVPANIRRHAHKSPSITWVSGATRLYSSDLQRLVASTKMMGSGHRFELNRVDADRWIHLIKFDLIRKAAATCETSHIFWIDADCEFVEAFEPGDVIDPAKPLVATRHFFSTGVAHFLAEDLKKRITWKDDTGISWQSCLFGGETGAIINQIDRLSWMAREGVTYDEYGLVLDWSEHRDLVHTLPCRYAMPESFAEMREHEPTYYARAGGTARIVHHNRNMQTKVYSNG